MNVQTNKPVSVEEALTQSTAGVDADASRAIASNLNPEATTSESGSSEQVDEQDEINFDRFMPILQRSFEEGGTQRVAVTNKLLLDSEPEYQKFFNKFLAG